MPSLSEALAPWHDFYTLLGAAAAAMIGLLFVAASVGGGIFSQNRRGALRIFLSASVVQFATVLATCLCALAPLGFWALLGLLVLTSGGIGLTYSAMAWRDTVQDGINTKMDMEDRLWYAVAPAFGYFFETLAGVALILHLRFACAMLAVAMGLLLLVAIHNSWDITVWSVTRRKE